MLPPDEPFRQAAEPSSPLRPQATPEQQQDELLEWLAQRLAARGLEEPAIFFLEMHKPLSFIAGQSLLVASPFIAPFIGLDRVEQVSALLSDRSQLERLIRRLEELRDQREENLRPRRKGEKGGWPFRRRSSAEADAGS